jgi:CRP-like cAMP-binding protein
MIAPELLGNYPIFTVLDAKQIQHIAQIAKEESYQEGTILFREGEYARDLYLLLKGGVELFFTVEVEHRPELRKEFIFRGIKPGELFGISALIEPYVLTATARFTRNSQVIKIDARTLLEWCTQDPRLAYGLIQRVAEAAIRRLNDTRLQLAAAWSAVKS